MEYKVMYIGLALLTVGIIVVAIGLKRFMRDDFETPARYFVLTWLGGIATSIGSILAFIALIKIMFFER